MQEPRQRKCKGRGGEDTKKIGLTPFSGFIGYYQQQVTEDSGPAATSKLDRKIGAGPEISAFWPQLGLFTSLRYAHEFAAVERPEGDLITLTLTKPF